MSQSDFQKVVEKIMSDESFASTLANNPGEALKGIGIDATPEMLEALNGVDAASIQRLAASLGDEKAAG